MADRLAGKVALVTGGSSGIGRATALAFAKEGAQVVVADVDVAGGQATVQQIQGFAGEALFVRTDVAQAAEVEALVTEAIETYGRLDCAFNNAGLSGVLNVEPTDYPEEVWHQVLSVNLTGVWLCMKYEIRQMLKQGKGAIVNTASVMGLVGVRNQVYCASKHGVVGLTKSAALSYSQAGIRINAVCPGFITTPMVERVIDGRAQVEAELIARHPIGRLGTPEEIAEAVVWLCSDASSFVTGSAMTIDGGYVAQ
jgi:NAD(P)-dependent dehydrogenase (short-subunit alcohol dehydrogenase family)